MGYGMLWLNVGQGKWLPVWNELWSERIRLQFHHEVSPESPRFPELQDVETVSKAPRLQSSKDGANLLISFVPNHNGISFKIKPIRPIRLSMTTASLFRKKFPALGRPLFRSVKAVSPKGHPCTAAKGKKPTAGSTSARLSFIKLDWAFQFCREHGGNLFFVWGFTFCFSQYCYSLLLHASPLFCFFTFFACLLFCLSHLESPFIFLCFPLFQHSEAKSLLFLYVLFICIFNSIAWCIPKLSPNSKTFQNNTANAFSLSYRIGASFPSYYVFRFSIVAFFDIFARS